LTFFRDPITMKRILRWFGRLIKWACLALGAACLLGLLLLAFLATRLNQSEPIADHSMLVLDLADGITDRPAADESARMLRDVLGTGGTVSLRAVTQSLRAAATDPRVAGVYLRGSIQPMGYESGLAALKEVREALLAFRQSGKPVIAYLVDPNQRDLYLASVAEPIWLNPSGTVEWHGLAATGTFFKGLGDRYGVEFQPIRHGKFKSAVEPFLREDFSPESREQLGALLHTAWTEITRGIAEARKLKPEALDALAENQLLLRAEQAKTAGLVTGTAFEGEVLDKLRTLTQAKADSPIPHVAVADYAQDVSQRAAKAGAASDKIAVVYAEGEIVDGAASGMGADTIAGDTFAKMLREVREDSHVKAVVLRVNSPGGSATASDVILDELRRLRKTRPVIVSMGTVAASGGYLISTASDRIFAEPATITGSIGVFGMALNVKKLANDHGLTFDAVKTAPHADFGTMVQPMSELEMLKVQELIDGTYLDFLKDVAACRKMTTNQVDELAQGRVWSGADALQHGLVDELGGLDAAIADAAKRAKLGKYTVAEYPAARNWLRELLEGLDQQKDPLARLGLQHGAAGEVRAQLQFLNQFKARPGVYARLPFNLVVR
jgi:protease IV